MVRLHNHNIILKQYSACFIFLLYLMGRNMKKIIALAFTSSLFINGCVSKPVSDAHTTVSDFDGSKSVAIASHSFKCTSNNLACSRIGFAWMDTKADEAYLLVSIREMRTQSGSYAISGVRFNIDGEIVSLEAHKDGTNRSSYNKLGRKTTSRLYVAPISVLNKIKKSNITKLQIVTKTANFEGSFKDSGESTDAYQAMIKFLAQVNEAK